MPNKSRPLRLPGLKYCLCRRGQICIYHLSDPLQTQVHQPPQLPVPLKVALVVALDYHKTATRKG